MISAWFERLFVRKAAKVITSLQQGKTYCKISVLHHLYSIKHIWVDSRIKDPDIRILPLIQTEHPQRLYNNYHISQFTDSHTILRDSRNAMKKKWEISFRLSMQFLSHAKLHTNKVRRGCSSFHQLKYQFFSVTSKTAKSLQENYDGRQ